MDHRGLLDSQTESTSFLITKRELWSLFREPGLDRALRWRLAEVQTYTVPGAQLDRGLYSRHTKDPGLYTRQDAY